MALDQRLIGLWNLVEAPPEPFYEITPTGRYFVHGVPLVYAISEDGTKLTIWYPAGPADYQRVGEPSQSLVGKWDRLYEPPGEFETLVFNDDGTFIGHSNPDVNFWGFFEDFGDRYRQIEYRGLISTEGERYRHEMWDTVLEYKLGFDGEDFFRLTNEEGNKEWAYSRIHT